MFVFSFILSFVYSLFLFPKDRSTTNTELSNDNNNNNNSKLVIMERIARFLSFEQPLRNIIVISGIIAFLVFTPLVSFISGKTIRIATPINVFKYEKIETPSLPEKKVEGILVSEQNNILYISSKNDFKLIRVKDESFKTQQIQPK